MMYHMRTQWITLAMSLGVSLNAQAMQLKLDTQIAPSDPIIGPGNGSSYWLSASFADVSPGTVQLTLSAPGLYLDPSASGNKAKKSQYVFKWMFNVGDAYVNNPNQPLSFSILPKTGSFLFDNSHIVIGQNAQYTTGEYGYDIKFLFSDTGGLNDKYTLGDALQVNISSEVPGFNALSFNYGSSIHGYYSTAKIKMEDGRDGLVSSSSVTLASYVSDGVASAWLMGLALAALASFRLMIRGPGYFPARHSRNQRG